MDTTAKEIVFNQAGECIFCCEFLKRHGPGMLAQTDAQAGELSILVAEIKAAGAGRPYDCIVGVSGGIDSSWMLCEAVRLGLRPLAVHMDNGWNSELAQNNISNLVKGLSVDLYTHVIDWSEYRELMQAFFDADVIDIELLYDNAMLAVNYRQAAKYGVRYILGGTNAATEGLRMPVDWNWYKLDKRQIKELARRSKVKRLNTFPSISTLQFHWYRSIRRIRWVSLLDLMGYTKDHAVSELQRLYGYKPYPYKHYESIFTRFYQGYLLPRKFGVDKRLLHLSNLVISNQLTRNEAISTISRLPYPSPEDEHDDVRYFLKKMGWTEDRLSSYLGRSPKPHSGYPSEKVWWQKLTRILDLVRN